MNRSCNCRCENIPPLIESGRIFCRKEVAPSLRPILWRIRTHMSLPVMRLTSYLTTPATTQLLLITRTRSESRGSSGAIAPEWHFVSSKDLVWCNLWLAQARCADKHSDLPTQREQWNIELLRSVSACESCVKDNQKVRPINKIEPCLNLTPTCAVAIVFS